MQKGKDEKAAAAAAAPEVNWDEINESSGFRRAEEYIWNAYESGYLHAGPDRPGDVEEWIDGFCAQAEQDGVSLERTNVKAVCTLGLYAGPRDEFQQRSGSGKAIYPNGDCYEGEFCEGKKHGTGCYTFLSKPKSEVDKLVEAAMVKRGKDMTVCTPSEADVDEVAAQLQLSRHVVAAVVEYGVHPYYHGDYVRGKRTGQGIMKNKDGTLYKGEFVDNKREGQGTFYYLNGDIYSGTWRRGLKNGYGTYHFATGGEYRGEWVNGNFVQGQWIMSDGTYYEGKFDGKNRPMDTDASMHYPRLKMAQTGAFQRGVWAPTSTSYTCDEVPIDGMSWVE